jgi:protein RecA
MGKDLSKMNLSELLGHFKMDQIVDYDNVMRLPTGSLMLDDHLGGGWAVGRINELWGAPSYGKSLISMITVGRVLEMGGRVLYIDTENSWDPTWAKNFLDIEDRERFTLAEPNIETPGERVLDMTHQLVENQSVDLIVLDSKDELLFQAEQEGSTGDFYVGVRARILGIWARKMANLLKETNITFLLVSQLRKKIGAMADPDTTSGGLALEHACSIRLRMHSPQPLKEKVGSKEIVVGKVLKGKTNKNKTAKSQPEFSFRVREFETELGSLWTVDTSWEIVEMGTELGMFTNKGGDVYTGNGTIVWNGVELGNANAAIEKLRGNPDLRGELEQAIREKKHWHTISLLEPAK